jgi:hypothetical protein
MVVILSWNQVVLSQNPAATPDPLLDLELNADSDEPEDLVVTLHGMWSSVDIPENIFEIVLTLYGEPHFAEVVNSQTIGINCTLRGSIVLENPKINWVKWSNIGSLDFTIGKDNVAGERPMPWRGWVYEIKKLGNRVIVYGQYGVSSLNPSGVYWGLDEVTSIGVKCKGAICGGNRIHLYIDKQDRLCKFLDGGGLEILGYSEFLSSMSEFTRMFFDEINGVVYICDNIYGYVYDIGTNSFGTGPVNITGLYTRNGTVYATSFGSAISTPVFSICSDIYDFGNRKYKTISTIEIGTDLTTGLYAAVDYRVDKATDFTTSSWSTVNPDGVAVVPCFGVEFRVRVKTLIYEDFEIDYLRINGIIH